MDKNVDGSVRDVGLISAAQRVEHYEMAVYGSVRTWAQQLGRADQASLLQQTLDEEKQTNDLLTHLALDSINRDATMSAATHDMNPSQQFEDAHSGGPSRTARKPSR